MRLGRASADFPVEPVRSLDAIHLAGALWWRDRLAADEAADPLAFASVDERLRVNARTLGFALVPA